MMEASEGDIVRVDLGEQFCCYGKLLAYPLICFYDMRFAEKNSELPRELGSVLFKIWVSKEGWANKRWKIVGQEALSQTERNTPEFFKKDKISEKYYKYKDKEFELSTREECLGLERAAVWNPVHVEERLNAHFSGGKSTFEEAMKA